MHPDAVGLRLLPHAELEAKAIALVDAPSGIGPVDRAKMLGDPRSDFASTAHWMRFEIGTEIDFRWRSSRQVEHHDIPAHDSLLRSMTGCTDWLRLARPKGAFRAVTPR